jgi:predicted amidophosphoribosyltransferase
VSIAIVALLLLLAAAAIAYPLLPGRTPSLEETPVVTNSDIERAVHDLRRARSREGHACPACGQSYEEGDFFCVRCGGALPQAETQALDVVCPSCGAPVREGDEFCAKCGHSVQVGGAA